MECTGTIKGIAKDFLTGSVLLTVSINEPIEQDAERLGMDKLSISIKKWRKKRSLDANAYAWVLMSKLASAHDTSKEEIYELMLKRYGEPYKDDDGYVTITVKSSVDMSRIDGHWLMIKESDKWKSYMMVKGSSEYDSSEMARFIDGIVSECKECKIETATPEEIDHMKEIWNEEVKKRSNK